MQVERRAATDLVAARPFTHLWNHWPRRVKVFDLRLVMIMETFPIFTHRTLDARDSSQDAG
jgi:hypothetical protein